jgi:hypothetical protein
VVTDALYYPWIDPSSKTILVNSLLYWDKLHTIVPSTVKEPFKNQWSKAAHDYGFLRPRHVDPYSAVVHRASEGFACDLERQAIQQSVSSVKHLAGNSDQKGYLIYPG